MSNCGCKKHEFLPVIIPSGTVLPIQVYIYFPIGKFPIINTWSVNGGERTQSPLIVATTVADAEGYVRTIILNPAPDEANTTTEDLEVNIYPQDIY